MIYSIGVNIELPSYLYRTGFDFYTAVLHLFTKIKRIEYVFTGVDKRD